MTLPNELLDFRIQVRALAERLASDAERWKAKAERQDAKSYGHARDFGRADACQEAAEQILTLLDGVGSHSRLSSQA